MGQAIDAVNDEMVAAGVRVFVGGLRDPETAVSIRRSEDGSLAVSSRAYLQASDFVNGFWVLEVADEAEAVMWGRKAAAACRGGVEVRAFH